MKKHTIIYAHGFGVKKDDRGLFTDIAKVFPDTNHIMFDLDICDDKNNTVTIRPFSDQVSLLNNHIKEAVRDPNNIVDVVAKTVLNRLDTLVGSNGLYFCNSRSDGLIIKIKE